MTPEAQRSACGERIEVPGAVVERVERPEKVDALAELVAEHHARGASLLVCGGRTRLDEANRARPIAAALSLAAISGIDVFEPDEGVVHALAGTPIRELRAAVAAEGWELPLDPPGPASTVGGTIASAAVGPRAHAFGRVADAVLGLELVGADGVRSKCGGRVVKNVTGYDLAKLYTGSFGSLAVVSGAWLRLRPQPARRLVLVGRFSRDRACFERARSLARSPSVRAFVWEELPDDDAARLVLELGGSEAVVAHDRALFEAAFAFEPGPDDAIDRLRDARARGSNGASSAFDVSGAPVALRARVLAPHLDAMREALCATGLAASIDLGLGIVSGRGTLPGPEILASLRTRAESFGGHAVFEWMPAAWRDTLDVFGEQPGTRDVVVSLKQRFDPRGILNPGRFVSGT